MSESGSIIPDTNDVLQITIECWVYIVDSLQLEVGMLPDDSRVEKQRGATAKKYPNPSCT